MSILHHTLVCVLALVLSAAVNAADLIKCVIGYFLLRSGFWMNNMAGDPKLAR